MTTYIVGCEYMEYDTNGQFIGHNEDPIAGEFTSLDAATAYAEELKSDPSVY